MQIKFEVEGKELAVINSSAVPSDTDDIVINGTQYYIVYAQWNIQPQKNPAFVNSFDVTIGLAV